jgi:hypothetical protein
VVRSIHNSTVGTGRLVDRRAPVRPGASDHNRRKIRKSECRLWRSSTRASAAPSHRQGGCDRLAQYVSYNFRRKPMSHPMLHLAAGCILLLLASASQILMWPCASCGTLHRLMSDQGRGLRSCERLLDAAHPVSNVFDRWSYPSILLVAQYPYQPAPIQYYTVVVSCGMKKLGLLAVRIDQAHDGSSISFE